MALHILDPNVRDALNRPVSRCKKANGPFAANPSAATCYNCQIAQYGRRPLLRKLD